MEGNVATALADGRELVSALRELGELKAPAETFDAVRLELGLDDAFAPMNTPLGPAFVAFNRKGVRALALGDSADEFARHYQERFGRSARPVGLLPPALQRGLDRWARGDGHPNLTFDLSGLTEFEAAVLRKALEVPRGEIRPYAWIAREIGQPRAVRAVGSALGRNPIPLLIPCHRVVRSDGSLGHYGLGDAAKRVVLTAEGVDVDHLEDLVRSGARFHGSDTTRIFCYPTCRHARRVTEAHRQVFRSETEARSAGYRPCKVCRPAVA